MDDKELYDCSARQAELSFNSFVARREHQWKVSVGLWAAILLVTEFFLKERIPPPQAFWLVASLVVVLHAAFVAGVWRKSQWDESLFRHYRDRCADLIAGQLPTTTQPRELPLTGSWRFVAHGASQFQVAMTVLLCVVCSYSLYRVRSGSGTANTPPSAPGVCCCTASKGQ